MRARRQRRPLNVNVGRTHRTIASIFFLYVGLMSLRYSGLINMAAKLKAEFFSPARWHSITADVSMGTTSAHKDRKFQCLMGIFFFYFKWGVISECGLTWRKLADVVADTDEHASRFQVVPPLYVNLHRDRVRNTNVCVECHHVATPNHVRPILHPLFLTAGSLLQD